MGIFSLGNKSPNQSFKYIPRYYDPQKEDLQRRLEAVDKGKQSDVEGMKHRISTGMRRAGMQDQKFRKRQVIKSNLVVMLVAALLVLLTGFFIYYYLPEIMEVLG